MKRYFVMRVVAAIASVVVPGLAQEPQMSQATPDLSGTGHAKYLPIWTNSSHLCDWRQCWYRHDDSSSKAGS